MILPVNFGSFQSNNEEDFPLYHPGMLEVKFRTQGSAPAGATVMGGMTTLTRASAGAQVGLGTLLAFERSGMIRRMTPLAEPEVAAGTRSSGIVALNLGESPMLAVVASSLQSDDPNAGVTVVELYNDGEVGTLESALRYDPAVESVSRVPVRYLLAKQTMKKPKAAAAAPAASALWNLAKIRWPQARQRPGFKDAQQMKVAVLDTGLDSNHPDLKANVAGYEFAHPTDPNASSARDIIGHGTHVAGTITAVINNNVGINGICTCKLHSLKIFDDVPDWFAAKGYFTYFVEPVMYARALARCVTLNINVVNLSIGGRGAPSSQEKQLFARLIQTGTTVVAAMGNENSSIPSYPAAIPGVIAVGATSINDVRASFSNFGPHIALAAPGAAIWSTLPTYGGNTGFYPKPTFPPQPDLSRPMLRDTDYASWQGTSMASPHVAAAAALLLANKGALTPAQVKQKLQATAVKVPAMQGQAFTHEYGAGRLDLLNLLR